MRFLLRIPGLSLETTEDKPRTHHTLKILFSTITGKEAWKELKNIRQGTLTMAHRLLPVYDIDKIRNGAMDIAMSFGARSELQF